MTTKFLIAGLLSVVSVTAFGQKGELTTARDAYNKYSQLVKASPQLAAPSIATAKKSIDNASANAKTAELPETYAIKGAVYASLAIADTTESTSAPLFATANEAVKKAKELDTKGEFKKLIDDAKLSLAQYQLNVGVRQYKQKKYDLAYTSFDYYRQALPEDTNAIYYTALAASAADKYPEAITNYTKLLTTNFSAKNNIYYSLSTAYLLKKDTTGALKTIEEGIQKYPTNSDLRRRDIEISLQSGKQKEVLSKLESAIANDPKNPVLYYYAGLTNGIFADAIAKDMVKTKDPVAKAALQAKKDDYFVKAADFYKKAIAIDPKYFEATLNLGYALISPAIDTYNAANQLPASKQKEYDVAIAKSAVLFETAKPYILKAVELNPNSVDALANLKTYYLGTKNPALATETQKKIDAISPK